MRDAGATLVDVTIPSFDEFNADQSEIIVLIFEFKRDLNAYLATRSGVPVSTLADVIQFNLDHAEQELKFFGQELMELAEGDAFTQEEYEAALIRGPQLAGAARHRRDARGQQRAGDRRADQYAGVAD
jgi:amidase